MKDINRLCPSCMKDMGGSSVCPHCGFNKSTYAPPPHHLKPGSLLNGKYLVGKALGEGGFGITYVGYDLNLEIKLAIKEYFPNGCASRDVTNTDTVTIFTGSGREFFEQGRTKFINEAKTLARFDNMPGIVSVKDFFMENSTAYIVMEYVEGETLKDFLKRNGGRTSVNNILAMMRPLMKSLAEVHRQGLIHRDISPDNIMITKDSKVKLLDFGAARDISADGKRSLSIQLKPGYAPEEQYRSHGKQGPWTDVYALCATIYRAVTGVQPVEALERMQRDTLMPPSSFGIQIDPMTESALMRGMAIAAVSRYQSIDELYNDLYRRNSAQNKGGAQQQYQQQQYQQRQQYQQQQYQQQYQKTAPMGHNGAYNTPPQNRNNYRTVQPQNNAGSYNTRQYPKPNNSSRLPLILAAVIGGAVLILAVILLIFVINSASDTTDKADTNTNTDTVQVADDTAQETQAPPEPTPEVFAPPVFTKIEASSTRDTDMTSGSPIEYFPIYAIDGDPTTAWSADRNISLNPTLTLTADTKQHVTGIRMSNGYFKSEETYTRNRRITMVSIEYEGGQKTQEFGIDQYRIMQDIRFDAPVDTTFIAIHVLDTYYGDWKDICISEVEIY